MLYDNNYFTNFIDPNVAAGSIRFRESARQSLAAEDEENQGDLSLKLWEMR